MIQPTKLLILGLLLFLLGCGEHITKNEQAIETPLKLITAGGTITEIVYSLGLSDKIIATDRTSTYPKEMQQLPSIGYRNNITAEGLISLGADLILTEEGYLAPEVTKHLTDAGVQVKSFKNEQSIESTKRLISDIASTLKAEEKGAKLLTKLATDLQAVSAQKESQKSAPKVLFVYARGQGTLNIGGKGTFAESIIQLAGGQLAVPEIEGFKPLTTESLVAANPDYLLFFDSGLKSLNGIEGALEIPGVLQTKAGQAKQIIALDGLLLSGFDSRVGAAILELSKRIHPELSRRS